MKLSLSKKKLLTINCILAIFTTISCAAQQIDVSQQNREANIMDSIFEAANVEESQNGTQFNIALNPESFYLHDQGMVFSFNFLSSFGPRFGLNRVFSGPAGITSPAQMTFVNINESFPGLENAPSITGAGAGAFALSTEIVGPVPVEGAIQSVVAGAPMIEVNARLEELSASMREKQLELQILHRSLLENISENDPADEKDHLTEMTANIAAIESELAEDREAMRESYAQMQAEMAEQQAQREQERNELNKLQANSILTTLCEYGSTLKSLDNNENVTLIFKNINAGKDDLYIFSAQDVKRCSSVEKLLADGTQYQQ